MHKIRRYISPLVVMTIGVFMIVVGVNMSRMKNEWDESKLSTNVVPGTKGRNATIGAVGGGVLAGVGAFIVGGIGVVAMGTGVGAPAGIGLIAAATALGAGGGAVAGAATGRSETTHTSTTTIHHSVDAYKTWHWAGVMGIGVMLFGNSLVAIRKQRSQINS